MPTSRRASPSRDKVRAHRKRLRRAWVPDTRSRTFVREAHRQSLAVASSTAEAGDQAFVDAISGRPLT